MHDQAQSRTGPHHDPPVAAYATGQTPEIPIGIVVNDIDPRTGISRMSPLMVKSINGIHQTQQANIARNAARGKGKGKGFSKGKGKGGAATATPATIEPVRRFKGTDDTCSICTHAIQKGEWCVRVECNHVFHEECFEDFLNQCTGECECPNCRGNAEPKAFFQYVPSDRSHDAVKKSFEDLRSSAPRELPSGFQQPPTAPSPIHPSPSATYLVSSFGSNQTDEMNHRQADTPPQEYYIGERATLQTKIEKSAQRTKLNGGLSILVDLGSPLNFIGANTANEFARKAAEQDLKVESIQKVQPLTVCGIGSGASTSKHEAKFPIAVLNLDSNVVHDKFQANITEGCGNDLPAILGSVEMQRRDAVILLRHGKETIVFPGSEGYKIQWSEGTSCLPLKHAPSGHLVIPCDCYGQGTTTTTPTISSWTDHSSDIAMNTPSQSSHASVSEDAQADVPGNPNSVPSDKKEIATQTEWPKESCTDDAKISDRCAEDSPNDVINARCQCLEGGLQCMWPVVSKTLRCIQCTNYCSCACYGCDPHTSDSEVDEPQKRRSARLARTYAISSENGTTGWKQKIVTVMIMITLLICQVICATHYDANTSTGPSLILEPTQIVMDTSKINLDDFRPSASET
jgi:hypothetical protein